MRKRPDKPTPKSGRIRRFVRRRRSSPWVLSLAAVAVLALILLAAAPGLLPLALLPLGAVLGLAADRLREHWGWHRSGGKAAARRRRRYQGWAGRGDIARLRGLGPSTGDTPLSLGTAKGTPVAVHREKSVLYIGPPGSGKTGALACHAADAPGLLFATSTKTEVLLDTLPYRDGPFWVLNADGYGGIPSTLAWSPVDGCRDPATAMRRAGDLVAASPRDPSGRDAYHEDRSARLLRCMLHAAAIDGASMREVAFWVRHPLSARPMEILQSSLAAPGWDRQLAELLVGGRDGDWITGLVASASASLGWMDDPVMAAAASPRPGEGFSARRFARGHGSVYLIGKKRPHGSLAPYFSALGAEVFEQLKAFAMETPSGRLPVPATFVLDEMPLTCPLPLHDMLAEARGPLITFVLAAQTIAQLRAKFGRDDGDTIRSACPVEVIFGGEKRHEDLEDLSAVIGNRDTWHYVKGDGGSRTRQPAPERLMPPEALRNLAPRKAVILGPACRPILAATPAIWERRGHVRADLAEVMARMPARVPVSQPAIEPPRREPIATPYAPSAIADAQAVTEVPEEDLSWLESPATSCAG